MLRPEIQTMKHFLIALTILAIVAVSHLNASDYQPTLIAAKLEQIALRLETQLERIRYAREVASEAMSLAEIRFLRELTRSEAELERQIENIERLKDQLQDDTDVTSASLSSVKPNPNNALHSSLAGMMDQIRKAGSLMNRIEAFRSHVEGRSAERLDKGAEISDVGASSQDTGEKPLGSQANTCSGPTQSGWVPVQMPPTR